MRVVGTAKAAGVVDYEHLKQGLRDAGIDVRDSESFHRLLQIVDQDLGEFVVERVG